MRFFAFLLASFLLLSVVSCDHHDELSPVELRSVHLFKNAAAANHAMKTGRFNEMSSDIPASMIVIVPQLEEGPFFEDLTDYEFSTDLLAAAKAGSPGVSKDRLTVLDGTPFTFSLYIYSVSGTVGVPLVGASAYIWQCDAIGVYSAVPPGSGQSEDTSGQKWLRGYQVADTNGLVTFNTIIPGWYAGRTMHWHLRIRLPNAASNETFAVTTQVFPSQTLQTTVSKVSPYTSDKNVYTPLITDHVYKSVSSSIAQQMVLNITGTASAYSASFNLGIAVKASA